MSEIEHIEHIEHIESEVSESELESTSSKECTDDDECDSDEEVDELYQDVTSFDDLLNINVQFLRNEISHTYYYLAPFGNCEDHEPRRKALIDLHINHRIYTICGQANVETSTLVQYSYLEFIVEPNVAPHLAVSLFLCPDIYTSMISYFAKTDNFPKEKKSYNLTKTLKENKEWDFRSNWWRDNGPEEMLSFEYSNVDEIFVSCVLFMIVVKDNQGKEADEILREMLENLDLI